MAKGRFSNSTRYEIQLTLTKPHTRVLALRLAAGRVRRFDSSIIDPYSLFALHAYYVRPRTPDGYRLPD